MSGATHPVRRCATMEVHRRLLTTAAGYAEACAEIENFTYRRRAAPAPRTEVVCVPVVVHVLWRSPAENLDDAQVHSQLDVLNQDFRAANPDLDRVVPQVWRPLVADARLEFRLATVDPGGEPTTGIVRTRTAVAGFGADDAVKSAATGGSDPWPADRYLNLWVCQLAGGLLGYAQFPGGPAATDGVVVTHTGFGTTGTATAPFDRGRTTTHEVGHWLNLRHIWGDDGDGCHGSDFVADTPNQSGPNLGCPTFPSVSCDNAPDGDMFVNYMDYADDACMAMFTTGQVARIDATLAGPRAALAGPRAALFRRWVRVPEEDRAGVRVYRPATDPLPPARGREGIELRPDGTYLIWTAGPVDAPVPSGAGRWTGEPSDRLRLSPDRGDGETVEVVAVDDRVLQLRPVAGYGE